MQIIAHRGYWRHKKEQNTWTAFERAVKAGFGVETDFRDRNGQLVIAHDVPNSSSPSAEKIFHLFAGLQQKQILAINVKADGLQTMIKQTLKDHPIKNYFTFDASIPDALKYIHDRMRFFTRQSEFETPPHLLKEAQGVWLDSFQRDWFNAALIEKYLKMGRDICVVSPELQGRPPEKIWQILKPIPLRKYSGQLSICTDLPQEAKLFFER